MELATIIIPIYKRSPEVDEVKSLIQCLKVLGSFPIIFVCPHSLDLSEYQNILLKQGKTAAFESFDDKYFDGIEGYNQLVLSVNFYKRFEKSKFMLIYQLDAWVFRDELEYWCNQGYDYIGAPWFEGWEKVKSDATIMGVGNGGFSLRRTEQMIKLSRLLHQYELINEFIMMLKIKSVCQKLGIFKTKIDRIDRIVRHGANEDYHLFNISSLFKQFKIAQYPDALRFSFEVNPKSLYKINNDKLPFGCHAWRKHDSDFWKQFIKQ